VINSKKDTLDYRREIDGLRALAVLPVMLFHASFETFSGGFVGVDVFFVISGYLITTIILAELDYGKFSIVNFYERRALRILPTLFLVVLVCIPFAWFLMLPSNMKEFSSSLVAVSLFASNILFWRESGYFDTAVEIKPLLHTWSLAVEEQFYLLFPIFIILFWRLGKHLILVTLGMVFFASLALSHWGSYAKPAATFYLLPTRGWELLIGVFAAFYLSKVNRKVFSKVASEFGGWLGVALILYAVFAYSKATPFPSLYALVPTIGAVLIILFATQQTTVGKFLGNKVFVCLGLISYSAYLWHQPLFAFARLKSLMEPSVYVFLVLLVLTLILAYFSWKFVEVPFRTKNRFKRKQIFILTLSATFLLMVFGLSGIFSNGFENSMLEYKYSKKEQDEVRLVNDAANYDMLKNMAVKDCHLWVQNSNSLNPNDIERCYRKHGKAIIVLGDSHAMNLFNIISYSETYPFIIGISQGGCRPHNDSLNCHYRDFDVFANNNRLIIELVVFHQSGSYFIKDKFGRVDSPLVFSGQFGSFDYENIAKVKSYLNNLGANYDLNILWVGPFLEYRLDAKKELFTEKIKSVNPSSIKLFLALENVLNGSLQKEKFQYIPYRKLFYEPIHSFEADCFLFHDVDHYSKCGEKIIARKIEKSFLRQIYPYSQ
jgi:peptidoglycan/LPS O-acetylase OafA/YrhL